MIAQKQILTTDDMRASKQWVCWRLEKRNGKLTKVPYNPLNGRKAESNDPQTWGTAQQALDRCNRPQSHYQGIGFMFSPSILPIMGIDLDHCVNAETGQIDAWAWEIIKRLNTYAEYSPSGTGVHLLIIGELPAIEVDGQIERKGKKKKLSGDDYQKDAAIEMYCEKRYFTFTGRRLKESPKEIAHGQKQIMDLYAELFPKVVTSTYKTPIPMIAISDRDLLDKAMRAANGQEFTNLWNGQGGNDASQNDYKLCCMLAFWTGKDANRMDRLFRQSGLYRQKWDEHRGEQTYGEITLQNAINACTEVYGSRLPDEPLPDVQTEQVPVDELAAIKQVKNLCNFSADDAGNGDALYNMFGEKYLYCSKLGWLVYTGTHWSLDPDAAQVKRDAVVVLRKRRHLAVDQEKEAIIACTKADTKRVNGCIERFKTLVDVSIDVFDSDPDTLNCQNGMLHLRTGELAPHKPSQRFTYCVPVDYNPQANCPEWLDYLHGVVGGGQEVINYLQMAAGYSLTGQTKEEVLFYLFGPSRSGKGTFSEVMMSLLPHPLATMVDFNTFTAKREGDVSNFDLAPLKPSRMIFASESNRGQSLNPAKIKQMTGGDLVRACYKHKDFFSYRPQFKMWMLSNWPVNGDPDDDALWGRVRVIEFPNSFLGKEDKSKKERLKQTEALSGVLTWAVQGAMAWYQLGSQGLQTPESVKETTQKHRSEMDYIRQWLDERCEIDQADENAWTANNDLMASYRDWCSENMIQYPYSPKKFAQALQVKGFKTGMVKRTTEGVLRGVAGIKKAICNGSVTRNGCNGRIEKVPELSLWDVNPNNPLQVLQTEQLECDNERIESTGKPDEACKDVCNGLDANVLQKCENEQIVTWKRRIQAYSEARGFPSVHLTNGYVIPAGEPAWKGFLKYQSQEWEQAYLDIRERRI